MRCPRVLHVVTSDQRRGAERVAQQLDGQLCARGWDSRLVALTHRPPGGLGVPVLGARARSPTSLWALRRLAREHDVVVAHGSATLDASVVGLLGARRPVVYVNIGDPRYWLTTALRRRRVRWELEHCARVVAIAEPAAAVLTGWVGLAPERVTVIRNSRDAARFRPSDQPARRRARLRLGVPERAQVALVLGSLSGEKRVDVALESVALAGDVHALVVGDGPLRGELERLAGARLPGRSTFAGAVADPREALAAADVLLLTSDTEGVPGVLVEAGLSGLPTVATSVGFVADVVLDGVTGVLVPPGDPAAVCAGLRRALQAGPAWGAAARERCEQRHGVAPVLQAWEQVLREVV